MSPNGFELVKAFESCMEPVTDRPGYFKPYFDPVHILTIGWGHTRHHFPPFDISTIWSQAECDSVLADDMEIFETHVKANAKIKLAQHEFDALVSWSYNTGGTGSATLWKVLNRGDKASIPAELAKWNRGGGKVLGGLVRRRKAEGLMFVGQIEDALALAHNLQVAATPLQVKSFRLKF